MTELDRSRDESAHVYPIFLPDGRRFLFLGRSNDRSKSAIYLASLDSQTRTRLLDVHSQPDYAPGFLLYQRGGAVMAHPFDEKQGRLTGDAVVIAEGVDTDTINWARGVFGFGKRSADLPVGTGDRWIWSPDVVRPQRQDAGHGRRERFLSLPARVAGRPARRGDVQQGRGRDGSVADRSRSRRSDPVHVPPGR